jgi:hypothetical protein
LGLSEAFADVIYLGRMLLLRIVKQKLRRVTGRLSWFASLYGTSPFYGADLAFQGGRGVGGVEKERLRILFCLTGDRAKESDGRLTVTMDTNPKGCSNKNMLRNFIPNKLLYQFCL